MSFEFGTLFTIGLGYLFLLFAIAYAAEHRLVPDRLIEHPATYVLSLAVFVSAFGIYGILEFAEHYGYSYLNYYIGVSTLFIVSPLLLLPLLRICRQYRLHSLADLLTFRFRSQWAGSLVTVFMLLAMLPLLTLQIQAVSEAMLVLTHNADGEGSTVYQRDALALLFCIVISVFAILFGSRHLSSRESHRGLVAAIAFESIVKMLALLLAGAGAVFIVFDGFADMQQWLAGQPALIASLNQQAEGDSTRMMLVMFFAAAVCLPHFFHLLFAENPRPEKLRAASWGLPLYLLLISLPIFPIYWAGESLGLSTPPDYYGLALGLETGHGWLSQLVFIGGLSAASGAIIVATLALASMSLNHLILPLYQPPGTTNIYNWLLWTRRLLIVLIILAGYFFHYLAPEPHTLSQLAVAAVAGSVQFFPGVLAVLYWPRGNSTGFIAGLLAGLVVWATGALAPLVSTTDPAFLTGFYVGDIQSDLSWVAVVTLSLSANAIVFIVVSLLTPMREEERTTAEVCAIDDLTRPIRQSLNLQNAQEMEHRLAYALGDDVARREVAKALEELQLSPAERRPYALRRLRDRIEVNLSALMGPGVAKGLVDEQLPYATNQSATSEDITFIESRLERYNTHLTGLAADLDNLRRYHRQTLDELPIGLCSLGGDGEILMWNRAMSELSGIAGEDITGSRLTDLVTPWRELLRLFSNSEDLHWRKYALEDDHGTRTVNLHKASVDPFSRSEQVIVVEDVTETQLLENKLTHQERLASIGRLAAGVAHEIGNPVTGIASLAQNLRYESDEQEVLESAEQIVKQTQRITGIVQSLVNFAHTGRDNQSLDIEPVDLRHCVDEAIQLLQLDREAQPVDFENRCPAGLCVSADNQRLIQVFINLLSNARDASPEQGSITVDAEPDADRVEVRITDQGSGIPESAMERLFEPFFTTKEPGRGTGLGLALVYNIIEDLGGDIHLESPLSGDNRGTRVHLSLRACASVPVAHTLPDGPR